MVTLVSTECRLSYCGRIADGGPFGQIAGERGDAGRARRSRVTDRAPPTPLRLPGPQPVEQCVECPNAFIAGGVLIGCIRDEQSRFIGSSEQDVRERIEGPIRRKIAFRNGLFEHGADGP